MNTIKITDPRKPLMVAHRGLSGLETENTCAAFVAAGNRSYFGIETDVHRTKDGKYVVFHDDTTGRLAEGLEKGVEPAVLDKEINSSFCGFLVHGFALGMVCAFVGKAIPTAEITVVANVDTKRFDFARFHRIRLDFFLKQ